MDLWRAPHCVPHFAQLHWRCPFPWRDRHLGRAGDPDAAPLRDDVHGDQGQDGEGGDAEVVPAGDEADADGGGGGRQSEDVELGLSLDLAGQLDLSPKWGIRSVLPLVPNARSNDA